MASRYRLIVIVLLRRVIAYEFGYGDGAPPGKGKAKASVEDSGSFWVTKLGEWETSENEHGLTAVSTAPGSTLLALPGRQPGHVQLVHLPPCGTPLGKAKTVTASFRSPILLAHTHPLSSLTCSATGSYILTASERGTLLRVWDTARGSLEKELRRGVDRAEIWGLSFEDTVFVDVAALEDSEKHREITRRKGGRVVGWSDKGTVHVWGDSLPAVPAAKPQASLAKVLGKALALPNYFSSTASTAQYYLPRKNPHAFSGAIGAAADAAGLPSMKINEDGDKEPQEREWAERYVVSWIEVDVESEPLERADRVHLSKRLTGGLGMGTREERHSFGSDATSTRTVTPSGRRAATPTQSAYTASLRRESAGSTRPSSSQSRQQPRVTVQRKTSDSVKGDAKSEPPKKEHQLVVITFAGDWYRLRLPRPVASDDGEEQNSRCELVEYRRLGVGGGGW